MRVKNLDLQLTIAIALANLVWITWTSHHPQIIGMLLALPQVFLLPGYTLIEMLLHKHPPEHVRRLVLSLGLSIAIVVLSGFILNKLPWGLSMLSWAIYLSTMTAVFSLVAMFLRAGRRVTVIRGAMLIPLYAMFREHVVSVMLLGAAVGFAIVAVIYSSYSVEHQRRPGFTELWILQVDPARKSCSALIGVESFEFTPTNYHIFMTTKGTFTTRWSWPIHLSPQQTLTIVRPLDVRSPGDVEIQVQLYRDEKPGELYRSVHLTLHSEKSKNIQEWQCTL